MRIFKKLKADHGFLYKILARKSVGYYIYLLLLALVSSFTSSMLLIYINQNLHNEKIMLFPNGLVFALLILLNYLIGKIFQTKSIKLTNNLLYELEYTTLKKLKLSSFENFNKVGGDKMLTTLNDINLLSRLPNAVISFMNAMVLTVAAIAYLFFISIAGGIAILVLMGILLLIYLVRNKEIQEKINYVREIQNHYYRYLRDVMQGFKQLKISDERNEKLYGGFILPNRIDNKKKRIEIDTQYLNNELFGNLSWYMVVGVIIFLIPLFIQISVSDKISLVIVILYLIGPVARLILTIPQFTRFKVALNHISDFFGKLDVEEESKKTLLGKDLNFSGLKLENVSFRYHNAEELKSEGNQFKVGPINLFIRKGEVIFITGGNGSGKTTLINLITGLNKPDQGDVIVNNVKANPDNMLQLTEKLTAVFSDHHLFSENYDGFDFKSNRFKEILSKMELTNIVSIDEEKNFIDPNLSKGQQKRLALIYAMLEDKPIIILDEWAAEQDPSFRLFFYTKMIPHLKKEGKTLIAITHDDKYFGCADRIIKMEYGIIAKEVFKHHKVSESLDQFDFIVKSNQHNS